MTPEQIASAIPIVISAMTLCLTTLGGAVAAFWLWYSKRKTQSDTYYQKTADEDTAYDRKRIDTGQALGSDISKQLLAHVITLTDGQFSNLRDIVVKGFEGIVITANRNNEAQEIRDREFIAALNQLIVFLSRNQASLPVIGHVENWADVEAIKAASIASAAEQKAGAIVDASTKSEVKE